MIGLTASDRGHRLRFIHALRRLGPLILKSDWLVPGSISRIPTGERFLANSVQELCVSYDCHMIKLLLTDYLANAEKYSDFSSSYGRHSVRPVRQSCDKTDRTIG